MSDLNNPITVRATVNIPVERAWAMWTDPAHIVRWNHASPDWHTPTATVDLKPGGRFSSRMEARDGSMGFDFWGDFEEVNPPSLLTYVMGDGRKAIVEFLAADGSTEIIERFEAENTHPRDLQEAGWQAILNNFKRHAEARSREHDLHFETFIQAPPEKVHAVMLAPETYQSWTAEFNESSRYEGEWKEGSSILFIGEGEDGKTGGMVSRIRKNQPGEYVSIEHLGLVQDGVQITEGAAVEAWAGALENYRFQPKDGGTLLEVHLETNDDFESYFKDTWPRALAKLKTLCEA